MSDVHPEEIIAEIDQVRDKAQAAFAARDVDEYMRMFSPDVLYKQKNGTILTHDRLAADVLKQLRVIPAIEISRNRETFECVGARFVEVLSQSTSISASALFLVTRTIEIARKGRYVWSKDDAGWRIVEVEILSDDVKSHWGIGFLKPRRIV
jgi:hypothetical protein